MPTVEQILTALRDEKSSIDGFKVMTISVVYDLERPHLEPNKFYKLTPEARQILDDAGKLPWRKHI